MRVFDNFKSLSGVASPYSATWRSPDPELKRAKIKYQIAWEEHRVSRYENEISYLESELQSIYQWTIDIQPLWRDLTTLNPEGYEIALQERKFAGMSLRNLLHLAKARKRRIERLLVILNKKLGETIE